MAKTLRDEINCRLMSNNGLQSLTDKLDIGSDSIYVKTVWMKGDIVRIDVTLSRGSTSSLDDLPRSESEAYLEANNYDLARSWVEDSCRMASLLLEQGGSIVDIVGEWKGVSGFPHGACPQLESIVPGPLHAAAMLIEKEIDRWKQLLTNH